MSILSRMSVKLRMSVNGGLPATARCLRPANYPAIK